MSNRVRRELSRRLRAWVTVLCFGFGYCIGCDDERGDTDATVRSDKTIDSVIADSGLVSAGRDSSTFTNTADIAGANSGPNTAGQSETDSSITTDIAGADSGFVATGQDGGDGSKDTDGEGSIPACTGAADDRATDAIGVPPVTSVVSGGGHVCLLKNNGSVICWGDNDGGQAEAPEGSFTQIGAAWRHTCGLKNDGSIVCWGNSDQVEAPEGSFTQISVGSYTSYALRQDGSIACWGSACSRQDFPNYQYFLSVFPSFGSYLQVSATNSEMSIPACAVRDDNQIACWGFGVSSGNTAPYGCYTQVAGNCAIRCNGNLVCWGCSVNSATVGPLTPAAIVGCGPLDTPTELPTQLTQISGEGLLHCGVTSDNSIACWRDIALPGVNGIVVPSEVILPAPTGSYTEVSAKDGISCAMKSDDSFACWNFVDTENGGTNIYPVPTPYGPYTQIGNNCGLKSDGQIVCWDVDDRIYAVTSAVPSGPYEQIGNNCALKSDGTITCWSKQRESHSVVERSAPSGSYSQLGNAYSHSDVNCAIKNNGAIVCWDWGATDSSGSELLRMRATPPGSYIQVNGSAALKDDGTLTCWEWDDDDAGIVNPDSYSLISTPPGPYTQVTYAEGVGCGIKSDGSLSCWGNDEYDPQIAPLGSFTRVSASGRVGDNFGTYNVCAIKVDGSVVCWQIGQRVPSGPSGSYAQVFAGVGTSCAIRCDNSIVCWGGNDSAFFPATL